jgi:hypothetical protein
MFVKDGPAWLCTPDSVRSGGFGVPAYPFLKPALTMLTQQQTTAACTDSAVRKFDDFIDRTKLAGRQTAELLAGFGCGPDADADAQESRVRAITGMPVERHSAPLLILLRFC